MGAMLHAMRITVRGNEAAGTSAGLGGGLTNFSATTILEDSLFSRNTAIGDLAIGGGFSNHARSDEGLATLTVLDSEFKKNAAVGGSVARGGGGNNGSDLFEPLGPSELTVVDSMFTNNQVTGDDAAGGGISSFNNGDDSVCIEDTLVARNRPDDVYGPIDDGCP